MGYFNIDLLKVGIHEKLSDYINGIVSRGYMPIILQPRRLSFSSATLIEHIYTNHIQFKHFKILTMFGSILKHPRTINTSTSYVSY